MRLLHTMLRVGDLSRSLAFYTQVLGMRLLRQQDYPEGRFTLAFVGYGEEYDSTVLELTHNWDTSSYDLGAGYGHIAIGVDDVYAACEKIRRLPCASDSAFLKRGTRKRIRSITPAYAKRSKKIRRKDAGTKI